MNCPHCYKRIFSFMNAGYNGLVIHPDNSYCILTAQWTAIVSTWLDLSARTPEPKAELLGQSQRQSAKRTSEWQQVETFANIGHGDIVRNKGARRETYTVIANYGDRVTAVTTADLTNADEWEVYKSRGKVIR